MPRPIAVIDCETDPFLHGRVPKPFLWGYYDGTNYEEFTDVHSLVKFLAQKEQIVYAHNGGKFDYHYILDYLEPYQEITIINGRLAKFKIGQCELRDSYNILPTALSKYQKTEIDYSIFEEKERNKKHNSKLIRDYLYDDCVYLYQYVIGFIEQYGGALTLAGAAMKKWKQISGIELPYDHKGHLYENFKQYYYGGRCQSFEHGIIDVDFQMADINSAYPYAMLHEHPYTTEYITLEHEHFSFFDHCLNSQQTAFVRLTCTSRGALPYRGSDNGLYFPDDAVSREYFITGWELLAALETNTIHNVKIHEYTLWPDRINFSEYINYFYERRKIAKANGDIKESNYCKLMMNSLYGKFGSNPDNYSSYQVIDNNLLDENGVIMEGDKEWSFSGDLGDWTLIGADLDEKEQRFYNVATSASITGFVRAYLWRALCDCGRPLYCDTDSIAAVSIGSLPNGFGKELGQWEIEGEFNQAALAGRKLYSFAHSEPDKKDQYKTAHKGARLEPEQIIEIAKGAEIVYQPESPTYSIHKTPVNAFIEDTEESHKKYFTDRRIKMVVKELKESA